MTDPGFWDRKEESQQTIERLKILKKIVEPWQKAYKNGEDYLELLGMIDANQADSLQELQQETETLVREVEQIEFQRLLSDPIDPNNAIVSINAGAGGTESC